MRSMNFEQLIQKYPPKHIHIKEPYWYETENKIEQLSTQKLEQIKPESEPEQIKSSKAKVLAFNYIWPNYGITFLEESIKSIINHVDKYVLYINRYSYIGNSANTDNLERVINIAKKYSKIEMYINDKPQHSQHAQTDNIGYYFKLTAQHAADYDYIFLVQSDEVYDSDNLVKFDNLLMTAYGDSFIFNPLCYIDTPHWVVDPPENFTRPSLIRVQSLKLVDFDYTKLQTTQTFINFHHFSYVLRRSEWYQKLINWGHRDNLTQNQKNTYYYSLDRNKTNKNMTDLHPIQPSLYSSVKYIDTEFHRKMFSVYVYELIEYSNSYDKNQVLFKDVICDFSENPNDIFLLTIAERQALSAIVQEMIPSNSKVIEYGTWNACSLLLMKLVAPKITLYGIDNYKQTDVLYGQYADSLHSVYTEACQKILKHNLQNTCVFDGDIKFLCRFKNDSIDFAVINIGITGENLKKAIIEIWPKLHDGSIICGKFSLNASNQEALQSLISSDYVNAPWGQQQIGFYETYLDLLGEVSKYTDLPDVDPNLGFWFLRVKK